MKSKLTAVIVAGCILVCIGALAQAAQVNIEPGYVEVVGDNVTVNITIDPEGDEVMGAQYALYFDNTLLHATDQTSEAFLSHDGVSTNVYKNTINNPLGKIEYSAARLGVDYGVTDPGVLATIKFEVRCSGVGELRLSKVKMSYPNATYIPGVTVNNATVTIAQSQPSTPFLISGYVFSEDGSDCNDPAVDITNLNIDKEWAAETDVSSNYYQLTLASCADIIAGEILQFNVASSDGSRSNVTEHTVTHDEVDASGFEHNIMIESRPGDINGDGKLTSADVAIALQMAVCGEYDSIADINCDKSVTSLDALMILQAADSNMGHSMTLSW
jgi:hypothetical protein